PSTAGESRPTTTYADCSSDVCSADLSSQIVHVSHVDAPSHGSTSIISSGPDQGKVLYTPDANYNGPDSFTYTATDNGTTNGAADPKSEIGRASCREREDNDAPTANPDTETVAEDGSVAIDAAANDSAGPANESSQIVHVSHVAAPSHVRTPIISPVPYQSKVLYTPDANYNGPDSFTYTATDNGTTNGAADPKS